MHFTHIDNLAQIVAGGELYSDALVGARLRTEVGDRGIKAARRSNRVNCGVGGHPADYVPFYFAPRSPMMYRIAVGSVEQYQDGQDHLIYLVTTIDDVVRTGLRWVFSNGNCGSPTTEYFDELELLDTAVDWDLQEAVMWNATADDPNRATRRAAEFLVHQRVPWRTIRWLVTRTDATASATEAILCRAGSSLRVVVRPEWYYNGEKYR